MERILYVPFDHLHRDYGVLREADPSRDVVLFVESERMLRAHRWHRQRVWFLVSAARHFAEDLRNAGYVVMYERAASTVDGISAARDRYTDADGRDGHLQCTHPPPAASSLYARMMSRTRR